MYTFQIPYTYFLISSVLIFGVGYTLLKYSRDGDTENRNKTKNNAFANEKKTTRDEAWKELRNLSNYTLVEVTWNVFMFIAIVSTMAFLGLAGKLLNEQRDNFSHLQKYIQSSSQPTTQSVNQNQSGVGAISVLFCLVIFSLQDLVHKWRNAHRRHPLNKEMNDIMDRLQYSLL
jgi:hypothetical protein